MGRESRLGPAREDFDKVTGRDGIGAQEEPCNCGDSPGHGVGAVDTVAVDSSRKGADTMTSIPSTNEVQVAMIAAALELSEARQDGADGAWRANRIEGFLVAYKAISLAVAQAGRLDVKAILESVGIDK